MCDFISWIEKEGGVFYLTYDEIYHTARGKELQKYCSSVDDYIGHGAIRHYWDIKGGTDKECTDFASPDNFPPQIARDIKLGKFAGLGIVKQLLTQPALAEYEKIEQPAWAEYVKIKQLAWAEYVKIEQPALAEYEKIKQPALAEYEKIKQTALAEYEKIEQTAWAEYEKIKQPAWAEYVKIEQTAFWQIFTDVKNRPKNWR